MVMNRIIILPLVLLMFAVTHLTFAGEFPIVRDNKAVAVIGIPKKPSELEQNAADDLQRYIQLITGAKLEITDQPIAAEKPAILVGNVAEGLALAGKWLTKEHVGYDGFVIRTYHTTREMVVANTPNRLVVAGRTQGTRYAAFELLHLLGCRFYAPHADGECIPQSETLVLGEMAKLYKPDFVLRRLWYSFSPHKGKHKGTPEDLADRASYKYWCVKNAAGGLNIDMGHNFATILPPAKYFNDHPQWFALAAGKEGKLVRGGTAAPDVPGAAPGLMQLCLSNVEVQQMFIDSACKRFGTGRNGTFSLSPADTGPERWCQCGKCKAMDGDGGLAQRLVTFGNIVATEVEKQSPGNFFPMYVEYYLPGCPVTPDGEIGIRCHPSLVPTFVNTYCPVHSPYDTACSRSREIRWAMSAWDRVSSQTAIRDYRMWSLFLPHPATWTIGPRLHFFRDVGAKWYSGEVLGRSPDSDLTLYLTARLLWDGDREPDEIIDEFFERYFGEVAADMEAYYRCLTQQYVNVHWGAGVKYGKHINRRSIANLRDALEPAVKQAQQPIVQRRVRREVMALDVYEGMVELWLTLKQWNIDKNQTLEVAQEIQAATMNVEQLLRKTDGMQLLAEHCNWWDMLKDGSKSKLESKLAEQNQKDGNKK